MDHIDWKKYALALVITSSIFGVAFYVSNIVSDKRIKQIQSIEDKIALDILSSETQFDLLREVSCDSVNDSILSQEINSLAEKLAYAEEDLGHSDETVIHLKRYYSLLQIKDFLLFKRLGEKCKERPIFIIYLYSNEGDCIDCEKEGYVLTYLRETYPNLRVYSFDYNLELPAIKTLLSIYKVKRDFPVLIINDRPHYGFKSKEDVEKLLPASITATTTKPAKP